MGSSWYRHTPSYGQRWPITSILIVLTTVIASIKRIKRDYKA